MKKLLITILLIGSFITTLSAGFEKIRAQVREHYNESVFSAIRQYFCSISGGQHQRSSAFHYAMKQAEAERDSKIKALKQQYDLLQKQAQQQQQQFSNNTMNTKTEQKDAIKQQKTSNLSIISSLNYGLIFAGGFELCRYLKYKFYDTKKPPTKINDPSKQKYLSKDIPTQYQPRFQKSLLYGLCFAGILELFRRI